jgi:transcriptional regulator with XRE-family HTH domain
MTDITDDEPGIGRRIKSYRKYFGLGSSRDLANAIPNEKITESVIQNIESGRKSDLTVSQLLEIAHAIGVSPLALLVPIGRPLAPLDLPNLSAPLVDMVADDFVRWVTMTRPDYTEELQGQGTIRTIFHNVQRLREKVSEWESWQERVLADEALKGPVPDETDQPVDSWALRNRDRTQNDIDYLVENLSRYNVDLSWAQRPWLESADG